MITIVKAKKKYVPPIGDLWWGDREVGQWLRKSTPKLMKGRKRLLLNTFVENPWDGLTILGVEAGLLNQSANLPREDKPTERSGDAEDVGRSPTSGKS